MAFEREVDVTKDSIGDYEIVFTVKAAGADTGNIEVQIVTSTGKPFTKDYDLIDRLADDAAGLVHLSNLIDLRDYLNIRLPAEVLPIP